MDLKKCPFCGEKNIIITADCSLKYGFAMCLNCGADGPPLKIKYNTEENAPWIKKVAGLWNERLEKE